MATTDVDGNHMPLGMGSSMGETMSMKLGLGMSITGNDNIHMGMMITLGGMAKASLTVLLI